MIGLCHRCYSSGLEVVPTGFSYGFYCLSCYELKDTKRKITSFENKLKKLEPSSETNIDAVIQKLKGESEG